LVSVNHSGKAGDNVMDQNQSVKNRKAMTPYKQTIARYIRSAMMLKGLKYNDLADKLEQRGLLMTPENLRSKVSKGMFSADLFVAIIEVLNVEQDALVDIVKLLNEK
jgi:hypothetical protein